MVTDTERREVAARLRELADYCDENEMSISDDDWPGILSDYIWPEDGGYHIYDEDCRRLADLIEPPACPSRAVRAYAEEVDWHTGESPLVHELRGIADRMDRECAPVDRGALLALAEDVDGAADDSGGFEPPAGMLRDIARSIREALGVSDDA